MTAVEELESYRLMKNDEPQGVRKANESSVLKVRDGIGFEAQHSGSRFSTACWGWLLRFSLPYQTFSERVKNFFPVVKKSPKKIIVAAAFGTIYFGP
ncbi:MAG: hypothetical protein HZB23_11665 [Deltaproteobacteria bacterium]|nr:hypothetical protein [Deltaproteobacteria bacterium]